MDIEDYKNKLSIYQHEFDKKKQELSREYAFSNNKIDVGDVITSYSTTIKVTHIKYSVGTDRSNPECKYVGNELTKKMQPRKDGVKSGIWQSDLNRYNEQLAAKGVE